MLIGSAAGIAQDDTWSEEPPLGHRLRIGDETHEIEIGKTTTIKIDGHERPVSVTAIRIFDKSGVRFEYPATFKFSLQKFQPGEVGHLCFLEGDRITVNVREYAPKLDLAEFAKKLREEHEQLPKTWAVNEQKCELKTGNAKIDGISFIWVGATDGQKIQKSERCFVLPSRDTETCMLLVIWVYGDELSTDAVTFLTVLEKTLSLEGSKRQQSSSK
jgi:hypothetical protein